MELLVTLFLGFGGYFLLSQASEINSVEQIYSLNSEFDVQQAGFKCPFPFGSYSDPESCEHYYVCVGGKGWHKKCKKNFQFDILRRVCLPWIVAVCGNKDKKTSEKPTEPPIEVTTAGKFRCTSFRGNFPDPQDCSKYYSCTFFMPSSKTCPDKKLFDAARKECLPEDQVNCGDRFRPGLSTSEDTTEIPTTTDSITEAETITTTTDSITETETESQEVTDEQTENPPDTEPPTLTPKDITTTEKQRETAPPETDCDEDDVDCIIDETGDPDDWFVCPDSIGSFPHPSSNRLFIFCMNKIPSVKKCGMNLIFSKELRTCVEPQEES